MQKIIHIVFVLTIVASIKADYRDPIRYIGNRTLDLTTVNNLTIPISAEFSYKLVRDDTDTDTFSRGLGKKCYQDNIGYQDVDTTSSTGTYYYMTFTDPEITRYAVESPYNAATHSAPISFHTTWHTVTGGNYSLLMQALQENTVFNFTFTTATDPDDPGRGCPTEEYYIVPDIWCTSNDTFISQITTSIPTFGPNGYCRILFSDQVEHYHRMWSDNAQANDFKKRCLGLSDTVFYDEYLASQELRTKYLDYFGCHKVHQETWDNCSHPLTYNKNLILTNGKGLVKQIALGRNTEFGQIDLNFTIWWEYWTIDFPLRFGDAFKYCNYNNYKGEGKTILNVTIYIRDPIIIPERTVPTSFWIIIAISAGPVGVLFLTGLVLLCTRSKRGFNPDVWKFKRQKKQIEEGKRQRKAEKQDVLQEKHARAHLEQIQLEQINHPD